MLDLAPFRESPAYLRMWIGGVASGIGVNLSAVAVGIHIYDLTGSTLAVSLVGGFAFLPMVLMALFGGALVDGADRKLVCIWGSVVAWASAVAIALLAWNDVEQTAWYYLCTTIGSTAGTLVGTARFAIHPRLVPRRLLPAAAALSGISAGLQAAVGPALAGVLVATVGYAWTYSVDVLLYAIGFLGIAMLPAIPPADDAPRVGVRAVVDGARFLLGARSMRVVFVLHLVATVFGRPQVLFPALGATVLGGGAITVGLLTSAGALGVLVSGLVSGPLGTVRRHGVGMAAASAGGGALIFALGLVLFGTMRNTPIANALPAQPLPIALAAGLLFAWGAADNVAGIFRTTMLQSAAPDAVRGRVQGFFTLILTAGPRLGDVFFGVAASLAALWFPPLLGGLVIIASAALLIRVSPAFRRYDAIAPTP